MAVFRQSPSKYRRRGRGVKMRYLWCRFNFWGQFCDIKFFHYMVFRSIFGRKRHDHLCLNLNNSKIWRRSDEIFSEIVQKFALYKIYAENLQNVAPFLGRVTLKTRHSTKVAIFEAPLYNLCKGMVSRVRCIFQRT